MEKEIDEKGDDIESDADKKDESLFEEDDTVFKEDEKSDDEKKEKEDDDTKRKPTKETDFQKKYWRDKAAKLEKELDALRKPSDKKEENTPEERKEKAARDLVKQLAREAIAEAKKQEEETNEKQTEEFEENFNAVLEDHDDITQEELLAVCEKYTVDPQTGYRIWKDAPKGSGKTKPKMPQPKRGGETVDEGDKDKPTKPRTWEQIRREAIAEFKKAIK